MPEGQNIMKKAILSLFLVVGSCFPTMAESVSSLDWHDVCTGHMPSEWYGSDEAQQIADIVLSVQKDNGGWMKNDQLHQLTDSQRARLLQERTEHSCLDNSATTQEMRYLARVYQLTHVEAYRESFTRALHLIFAAEKGCGGWSQYWPLTGKGSYQDYITFNDDLITNVMRLLQEVSANEGIFYNMVSEADRQHCRESVQRAIDVIIRCQIDDNGTPAAWCAQHDTITFLPAEGRPHELPSVSGSESASLLSYLMTLDHPSPALQHTIHTAVAWLDAHRVVGKDVVEMPNAQGKKDRLIVDKKGSSMWPRFIQLGGETGRRTYAAFFKRLQERDKERSYTADGRTYTYTEYEVATRSYDSARAYQPIYAIYDKAYPHLFYRFLYHYEDADSITDWQGCRVPTSLCTYRRMKYRYMGDWPQQVIESEYPAWVQRMASAQANEGYTCYELSKETSMGSENPGQCAFSNNVIIVNPKKKGYSKGESNTLKFSSNVLYTVQLPAGMHVDRVQFYGYDNFPTAAYISHFNGQDLQPTDYPFPAKEGENVQFTSHTFTPAHPIQGSFSFSLGGKQCCLIITLYEK